MVLLVGAALYGLLVGVLGVSFDATPLLIGLAALAAAALGPSAGLLPPGLALASWGVAVLLVRQGPVPDDLEAPVFLIGAALGMLVASLAARRGAGAAPDTGAAAALAIGATALLLADRAAVAASATTWTLALAPAGLVEMARGRAGRRRTDDAS